MAADAPQNKPSSFDRSAPEDAVRFLDALFNAQDYILIRPVEAWIEGSRKKSRVIYEYQRWQRASMLAKEGPWQSLLNISEKQCANLFFGVCPRVGPKGQFDLSWQIRTIRVLWADLDHCAVPQALKQCEAAGLPRPSVVVCSGNGVHLYWILNEPYLIDDAEQPAAVLTSFLDQGEGKKKKPVKYIQPKKDELGITLYLDDGKTPNPECPWGELSDKARHMQDVLAGLAAKIGGDHTSDLARCLRLPGTLNRKDERNGKQPVPCELVECEPTRRYPFSDFEALAVESPTRQRREKVAAIRLPTPRTLKSTLRSRDRETHFRALVNTCAAAEAGQRSERDWALLCWAVENGVEREELWQTVAGIGKFAERGRDYFERTLAKAEGHTRERIYERIHARTNAKASRNGMAPATPSMPSVPMPPSPNALDDEGGRDGDGDKGHTLPEEDTDPHRLAREWLTRHARHERPGDRAAYYRQLFLRWEGSRWATVPDHEMKAIVNRFIRRIFEEDARLQGMGQDGGEEGKPPASMPPVTKKLVSDVVAAIEGLALVSQTVEQPLWRGPDNPGRRNWIALCNGILDVDALLVDAEQVLRPHSPLWFSPACLPYDFEPNADCPIWKKFLARNFGDDVGKSRLLQQWCGYLLLPDTTQQKFLTLVGEGSNGKSVVCAVMTALLGHVNVSTVPLELFGDKFRLINTLGKLANIVAEVGELDRMAEGYLKAFVVGDAMDFEMKFKQAFRACPTARLVLATNNVPRFSDKSDGLWRRMLLIPCAVRISEGEAVRGMDKEEWWQERGELPGIFNWALAGLVDLRREGGFTVPQSCATALDEVRLECNPARLFLLENYKTASGCEFKQAVYQRYVEWCRERNYKPFADRGFGKEVKRVFKTVRDGKATNAATGRRENSYDGLEMIYEGEEGAI